MTAQNPLLKNLGLPHFDEIHPDHVVPAVREIIRESLDRLAKTEKNLQPTWEGVMKPLEEMSREISGAVGPVTHLLGVKNSEELRQAYQTVQGEIVDLSLRISQSEPIFNAMKKLQASDDWARLFPAQKRIVEENIRNARLSGIELTGEKKERFNTISKRLSEISTKFSNNVLDATKAFSLVIENKADMEGMPRSFKAMAAQSYNMKNKVTSATAENGPWLVTLDYPSFGPFMQHNRNRALREKVYRVSVTKAAGNDWNNAPIIEEILRLRREKAQLLGFKSFAELSLATKMANDVAAVDSLENELLVASKPFAEKEFKELQEFAKKNGLNDNLRNWDISFYAERLREQKYAYTDEELRPYFPMPKVLSGLFQLVEKLFGVKIRRSTDKVAVWHADVSFYDVFDAKDEKIASFYLDPYSRPENKRGGAWMDTCIDRGVYRGERFIPVAYLVCNGRPPVDGKPSLMDFSEVETLFHEFGHGLQHMLTRVDFLSAAGINGVEWDAVELPSQFMENWCYHEPTLMGLTSHVDTNAQLPVELFNKIKMAKNYRAASIMLRQLHFGMVDMELHHRFDPQLPVDKIWEMNQEISRKVLVLPPLPEDRFLCSFSHIFAGGYAAGYYSYKWAEVLSADAFSAFEEAGLDDPKKVAEVGKRFRETVLALGGSEHPSEVFRKFRGRDPKTDALLRHSGLVS